MSKKEVIAYAITHAPRGVKGGPYQGQTGHATTLGMAVRLGRVGARAVAERARALNDGPARVIRIVRARPTQQPHEASAVEVLRELVATHDDAHCPLDRIGLVDPSLLDRARVVLAASGPDPSEVVRAALRFVEHCTPALEGSAWFEATREFIDAVDAYRKAGGTP